MAAAIEGSQKAEVNGRFPLQRDARFSLRGFIGNTSSGNYTMDRFDRPLCNDQHKGYKTVTRFPYGSSSSFGTVHAMKSSKGRQSLHSGRVFSESKKGAVANRPLSPHLALKKPQLSATFSISHRIFGASLGSFILLTPLVVKFSLLYNV